MSLEKWLTSNQLPKIDTNKETSAVLDILKDQNLSVSLFAPYTNEYLKLFPIISLAMLEEEPSMPADQRQKIARLRSAKLIMLFGSSKATVDYLKRFEKQTDDPVRMLHDACLFGVPQGDDWNIALWQAVVNSRNPDRPKDLVFRIVPLAPLIERHVEKNKDTLTENLKRIITDEVRQNKEEELSQEYDLLQVAPNQTRENLIQDALSNQDKMIEQTIDKELDAYLKEKLKLPLRGKLDDQQRAAIKERRLHPPPEDVTFVGLIKERVQKTFREKVEKSLATKNNLSVANKNKADYIKEKLQAAEKSLRNIVEDKVKAALLSKTTPLPILLSYASAEGYKNAHRNLAAARLFFEYGLSEELFDKYLSLVPKDNPKLIPDIRIDGANISPEYKDYYLMKLPANDPRIAILGKLTSCCQSLGQEGEEPAINAITSEHAGAYVLCRKNRPQAGYPDAIVAQCWAWRGAENIMVFDSIESQTDFRRNSNKMMTDFFLHLGDKLVKDYGVPQVNVGRFGETPISMGVSMKTMKEAEPVDYYGYRDSRLQKLLVSDNPVFFALTGLNVVDDPAKLPSISVENFVKYLDQVGDVEDPLRMFIIPLIKEEQHEQLSKTIAADLIRIIKDPNTTVDHPYPAIYLCVNHEYPVGVAKWLIEHGADVKERMFFQGDLLSPIEAAAKYNNWALVDALWSRADVNSLDTKDLLIAEAMRYGQTELLDRWLDNKYLDLNYQNQQGQNLLFLALAQPNKNVVKWLQNKGVVDVTLNLEKTPLTTVIKHLTSFFYPEQLLRDPDRQGTVQRMTDLTTFRNSRSIQKLFHDKNINIRFTGAKEVTIPMQQLLTIYSDYETKSDSTNYEWQVIELIASFSTLSSNDFDYIFARAPFITDTASLANLLSKVNLPPKSKNEQIMLVAAKYKLWDFVNRIIADGADINATDDEGKSLLMYLLIDKRIDEAKKLVELQGALVDVTDARGNSPLSYVAKFGNSEMYNFFVKRGANQSFVDEDGNTPLHYAAKIGDREFVSKLIQSGTAVDIKNRFGVTPLHEAVATGQLEMVNFLLSLQADPAIIDSDGNTLLHKAASSSSSLEMMTQILSKGLDVNHVNKNKMTALGKACEIDNPDLIRPLLSSGASVDTTLEVFQHVAASGHAVAMLLSKEGSDEKAKRRVGKDLFERALYYGDVGVVKQLAKHTQMLNDFTDNGFSLLHLAIMRDHKARVKVLLDSGADPNAFKADCESPLMFAVNQDERNTWEIVRLLLQAQADPHQKDGSGMSPLRAFQRLFAKNIPSDIKEMMQQRVKKSGVKTDFFKGQTQEVPDRVSKQSDRKLGL
jgi:ankyrin repeat protein